MEATLQEYRETVKAEVDRCTDVSLLDLIHQLIIKSEREENKDNGKKEL